MDSAVARAGSASAVMPAVLDEKDYELVAGQLVERNLGALSSSIGGEIHSRVSYYCRERGLGWTFPADLGYACFPDEPGTVRKPDVSFVRADRLPGGLLPEGNLTVVPDLAVEVISPNDLAYDVDQKVAQYLGAGIPLIWVVHPRARAVRVHRGDGTVSWLGESEELSGEDVLPGLRCRVADFFPASATGEPA